MGLFRAALDKLKQGLARTRSGSAATLRTILTGQRLSAELLRDLERAMIQADIGVKTAVELRKDIEAAWERGEMTSGDEALAFLKDQLRRGTPEEAASTARRPQRTSANPTPSGANERSAPLRRQTPPNERTESLLDSG